MFRNNDSINFTFRSIVPKTFYIYNQNCTNKIFLMIYDFIVIGSGFGGSVASLRLVETGIFRNISGYQP